MNDHTRQPEMPDRRLQGDSLVGPTEAHLSASRAFAPNFDRVLEESDEILHLQREARRILDSRPASEFEGFGRLLDVVLPREAIRQSRIARALELELSVLQRLRASQLDPFDVEPRPLAVLARSVHLDYQTFWCLALRDHERLASTRLGVRSRSRRSQDDVESALRRAWERDTLDDASPA